MGQVAIGDGFKLRMYEWKYSRAKNKDTVLLQQLQGVFFFFGIINCKEYMDGWILFNCCYEEMYPGDTRS